MHQIFWNIKWPGLLASISFVDHDHWSLLANHTFTCSNFLCHSALSVILPPNKCQSHILTDLHMLITSSVELITIICKLTGKNIKKQTNKKTLHFLAIFPANHPIRLTRVIHVHTDQTSWDSIRSLATSITKKSAGNAANKLRPR